MKRWQLILAGLVAYLLVIMSSAPAALMDAGLQRISRGQLRLVEAQGTLWSGSGNIELRDARGRAGVTKYIAWRVLLASLLRGHLDYEVRMKPEDKPFTVSASLSGVEIADADIQLPATALSMTIPKLAPFGLSGDLLLHVDQLSAGRNLLQGKLTVQWRNAGSALVANELLGDYEMKLEGEGAMRRAQLRTLQGPMQLDGNGSWTGGDKPVFAITARVPEQYQQRLNPLLRLVAKEHSVGNFELRSR